MQARWKASADPMNRPWIIAVALVLGLVFVWLRGHDANVREKASLQVSVDSLARALASSEAARKAREGEISTLTQSNDSLRLLKQKTLRHVDTLKVASGKEDSAFAARLSDSLRAGFDSIRVAHAGIVAALEKVIRGDSLTAANDGQKFALRGISLTECQSGLAAALSQRDRALKIASPGLLTRITRSLPVVAISALAGGVAVVILKP